MEIRKAGPDDVAAIVAVGHETWPATYAFAGDDYVAHGLATWWSTEATRRAIAETTVLVAAEGDDVLGVGNLDERGPVPIIWRLYVRPAAQGRGAGGALLAALVAAVPDRPVRLSYLEGNEPAARFYARLGFAELRREPGDRPGWPGQVWLERPPSGLLLVAIVEMTEAEAGRRYEDEVLALLGRHRGTLERRTRDAAGTTEVHLIRFADRAGYESFMRDPERLAHREAIADAAPTTRVIEVRDIG
ncbi:GNAT family N-acetyltransferase [Asanoa sp. WMMD1127]|uniref:GNAT family N-acetyltransferase n=1 Tax=Asanoa sp. WMMD1127 TaxID=3016107 RepID=UPI002415F932|nr:GNAT family N-acetyltransferase [Asanoa sp. WMMD1127]MDG4823848.1 GNAT family N-acetyltransferase [Asanoa sp. WMMD1127]